MDHPGPQASTQARRRRRRLAAGAASLAVHGALLAVLLRTAPVQPAPPDPVIEVMLTPPAPPPEPPPPPPPKPAPAKPAPASAPRAAVVAEPKPTPARKPPPQRVTRKPTPSPIRPRLVAASEPDEAPVPEPQVSAAALASATTAESEGAGEGPGLGFGTGGAGRGGRCDMVRRLQRALRGDASVHAVVVQAHRTQSAGRPIVVWNGDWVRRGGEDGKGLAGLRQAIAVEVAFAPKPCREQAMRGLVLLSLEDRPGAPRIVLGSGAWRWSDLLFVR